MRVDRQASGYNFPEFAFDDLPDLLPRNALLIANNSRVIPARVLTRRPGGGKLEFLLLTPPCLIDKESGEAECLLKPAGKIKKGDSFELFPGAECEVIEEGVYGARKIKLKCEGDLEKLLVQYGSLPLPPYIKRPPVQLDSSRYQTIWSSKNGSIAAPTAGLHFTEKILSRLASRGIEWRELTLHVGYGTFSPARCENIERHVMHPEFVVIDGEAAKAVNEAKAAGRPVIAIGTTSLRALEGIFASLGRLAGYSGWINLFVYPGFEFKIVDGLITNFHLPKSTLLMLASAMAGREKLLAAYARAIRDGFRFFSYGDAMFIY